LDYHEYIKNCITGARKFILKDEDNNLPDARRKFNYLFLLDSMLKVLFYVAVLYILYRSVVKKNIVMQVRDVEIVQNIEALL